MSSFSNQSSKGQAFTESYFDIDDIISSQEKIPSKFEVEVQNLGFLDPGSESDHISLGTKMELPFWLARELCSRRRHTVSVELPKYYREGHREILSADATVVDLHKWGPFYYRFGSYLLHFDHPESTRIAKSLLQTMQDRFRSIMDGSQNASHKEAGEMQRKLDETETVIFLSGQRGLDDFQQWQTRQTEKLGTSTMVMNHRKRKRVQMEAS